ncbi:MAG TPA: hypothetical protein V6D17_15765 [Candidatus Obscuribacterales bacterium]
MRSERRLRKFNGGASAFLVSLLVLQTLNMHANAEVLQGRIEKEDVNTRIARPLSGSAAAGAPAAAPPLRIQRPTQSPLSGSLVDTTAFRAPLSGRVKDENVSLGLLKPNDFASIPPSKFNLGTERGSRELVLAWERWHKQLSAAIYERWSETADVPGKATLRVTVTKDRKIIPTIVHSVGGRHFERGLLAAIMSLDGNPGLTFPSKSRRSEVTFETDYVASTDVTPGYSWVRNDFEKVREHY